MAGFSFKMEGLDKLQKKLDRLPKTLVTEIQGEVRESAEKIARQAKETVSAIAADKGNLMRSISAKPIGPISFEVVAQARYAPYVEFGTGTLVKVPAGLEDYAIQFKGRGVKEVNLPARPFLFNNYLRERPEIIKRLKVIIGDLK